MKAALRRESGMTLIEMLAAITVMMILTAILAEVFLAATTASAKGKAMAEVYQTGRALKAVMTRDFAGATPDFFVGSDNGFVPQSSNGVFEVNDLPPGPYSSVQYGAFLATLSAADRDATLRRMLMGGSDYIAFTSSSATSSDKPVAKVFYVLRASGQLIRVVHSDTVFNDMDYAYEAIANPPASVLNFNWQSPAHMDIFEQTRMIAEGVLRLKFSYLDLGKDGPLSGDASKNAMGKWVDSWDWSASKYLPAAVKVQFQLIDGKWKLASDDASAAKTFDVLKMGQAGVPEAGEVFDPNNGKPFTFIVDLPLGTRQSGA